LINEVERIVAHRAGGRDGVRPNHFAVRRLVNDEDHAGLAIHQALLALVGERPHPALVAPDQPACRRVLADPVKRLAPRVARVRRARLAPKVMNLRVALGRVDRESFREGVDHLGRFRAPAALAQLLQHGEQELGPCGDGGCGGVHGEQIPAPGLAEAVIPCVMAS
jgi:hypothetical protein